MGNLSGWRNTEKLAKCVLGSICGVVSTDDRHMGQLSGKTQRGGARKDQEAGPAWNREQKGSSVISS